MFGVARKIQIDDKKINDQLCKDALHITANWEMLAVNVYME